VGEVNTESIIKLTAGGGNIIGGCVHFIQQAMIYIIACLRY
jgi:hypothetical protein